MKKKQITKKLRLNKETVSRLSENKMSKIVGGETELLCPSSRFLPDCPIKNQIQGF